MNGYTLRPYQKECIEVLPEEGAVLVRMATGLGKTVMFSQIPRRGRMLILSHRKELVHQPQKYFDCSFGIEQGPEHSQGEEVVSASVQSLVRRLDQFSPDDFDILVTDEAHHAAALSYKKIFNYFKPRLHVGVTATPNRGDHQRLDDIYERIVFDRDLKWGIENHYLSNINCYRSKMTCDLRNLRTSMGDFQINDLETAMTSEKIIQEIADVYNNMAKGKTLIFAVSVKHAEAIAEAIPGAVSVTGNTEDRQKIIDQFQTDPECNCMVNCMIFTEGTDIPNIETIIVARPTQSETLYTQMVGRGTRLYPGKEALNLIDMIGVSGQLNLCSAPSLLGISLEEIPENERIMLEGDLLDLPQKALGLADTPLRWRDNAELVNLWAQQQKINLRNINFFRMPDGGLLLTLPKERYLIPPPDECGQVLCGKKRVSFQEAIDSLHRCLINEYAKDEAIWNQKKVNAWGKAPASEKQIKWIKKNYPEFDTNELTKAQASSILNRIFSQKSNIKTWDNPDYRKVEIRKKTETISQTRDYYVVFEGRQRGVFRDWESCKAQISGYQNALYRRFTSKEAADQALKKYRVNKRTIRQVHMDNTDFLWK
ncbi:viroplasmin family protein [Eubacterium limosum]|uniref:ribonuclease H1 domain-containing protein n=1 Tax=Eubacterium limosum TaxID=1736 RepID=UPI0022E4F33F|nr:viroplasmin family protein [Eubacterium limosum]